MNESHRRSTGLSPVEPRATSRGFTLIELLVVITIIVVLLALLTPALDRAIYQAELVTCGARMRGNTAGILQYTMENRRYYPNPPSGRTDSFDHLGPRAADARSPTELIPLLEKRFSLDAFKCPLLDGISYDEADNNPETRLYSNYYMMFAQRYVDLPGNGGMYRLGDALTHRVAEDAEVDRFNVLFMDLNGADVSNLYAMSGHPDLTGTLPRMTWQNELGIIGLYVTFARWQDGSQKTGDFRGPTDLNFAYDDGSVERLLELKRVDEDRTIAAPYYLGGSAGLEVYIPN